MTPSDAQPHADEVGSPDDGRGQAKPPRLKRADLFGIDPTYGDDRITGKTCGHCGFPQRGAASVNGADVCHPNNDAYPDCYRLVTVYGETLGSRIPKGSA